METLIIIPAYNEEENLPALLRDLKNNNDFADVIFIDDCSRDKTRDLLLKNGQAVISNLYNMGYVMGIQTGIKYALENNYDYVIQMDADGQHTVEGAKTLYNVIRNKKCNIVIGSRYIKKTNYKCPAMRRFGTKFFEILINILCRKKITDPLSGFQCLDKKVMREYVKPNFYPEYPDANLLIEMLYLGYSIEEAPVEMKQRLHGESMHSGIIKPMKYMI